MKNHSLVAVASLILFSSFLVDKTCEYASSNMNYSKSQIEKSIGVDDINQAKYYANKAINAIEKSKQNIQDCGCVYAESSIEDGKYDLILATRATSLNSTRILLNRALEHLKEGIESLGDHGLHESKYGTDLLALNTIIPKTEKIAKPIPNEKELERKIDASLEKYRESLENIINSVDCASAKAFAKNIYSHCEQQLLIPNLSEGKKYYNFKTKQITAEAMERLDSCN